MVRAGMSNMEALRTATTVAASVLGMNSIGRLQKGALADIVLLKRNPLDDIEAIKDVSAVVRDGYLLLDER